MSHTENKNISPSPASKAAIDGLFLCAALILSYLETLIPLNVIIPVPGFKLGFANIAVMLLFVYIGISDALSVSFLRVLISSFLFGSVTSFWFSLLGAVFSFVSLLIMKQSEFVRGKISWMGVSVICASAHNIGQIAAAAIIFGSVSVLSYLPYLLIVSVVCGAITGSLMCVLTSNKAFSKYLGKYMILIVAVIIPISIMSGCSDNSEKYKSSQMFYMDTVVDTRFSKTENVTDERYSEIEKKCGEIIGDIEKRISRTLDGSYVYKINTSGSDTEISTESMVNELIRTAFSISEVTDGAYDPTLGYITDLWNIGGGEKKIPDDSAISEALSHTGKENFEILSDSIYKRDFQAKIDLGGIGKGYAADEVVRYLNSTELDYGLISMGGNVGVFGEKPDGEAFKIGIRDPDDLFGVVGYLYIKSGFVSVSGDYERYIEVEGKRYHHIFDPKTGYPAESGLRSVAVWCKNGTYADALSTALFVMGCEKGLDFYNSGIIETEFEAVFITSSNEVIVTEGLKYLSLFEISNPKYTWTDR